MKRFLIFCLLLLALPVFGVMQTNVTFTLTDFSLSVASNRVVILTPESMPSASSGSTVTGDKVRYVSNSNGVFTVNTMQPGVYLAEVQGPPSVTRFRIYVPSGNLVTNAHELLTATATSTFPAGSVAWSVAVTDSRYPLRSEISTNSFGTNTVGDIAASLRTLAPIGTNAGPPTYMTTNAGGQIVGWVNTNAFAGSGSTGEVSTAQLNTASNILNLRTNIATSVSITAPTTNSVLGDRGNIVITRTNANRKKILILGSSVSRGILGTTSYAQSWVGRLEGIVTNTYPNEFVFVNRGVDGNTSQSLLDRLSTDVRPELPDYVIISLGFSNEGVYSADPTNALAVADTFIKNNLLVAQYVERIGAIPIICTPYPNNAANASTADLAFRAKRAFEESGYLTVDFTNPNRAADGTFMAGRNDDAIHPNDVGHAEMAAAFNPALFRESRSVVGKLQRAPLDGRGLMVTRTNQLIPLVFKFDPTGKTNARSWTASFWVYDYMGFTNESSGAEAEAYFGFDTSTTRIRNGATLNWFQMIDSTGTQTPLFTNTQSRWANLTIRYDATATNLSYFANGALMGSFNENPAYTNFWRLTFGRRADSAQFKPHGMLFRDVSIHQSPLSTNEIKGLYEGRIPPASLVGWFPLNSENSTSSTNVYGAHFANQALAGLPAFQEDMTATNGFFQTPVVIPSLAESPTFTTLSTNGSVRSFAGFDSNGKLVETAAPSGSSALTTNANQFGASTALTIKSEARLTNVSHYGSLLMTNDGDGLAVTNSAGSSSGFRLWQDYDAESRFDFGAGLNIAGVGVLTLSGDSLRIPLTGYAANKVLTSDGSGYASWQAPATNFNTISADSATIGRLTVDTQTVSRVTATTLLLSSPASQGYVLAVQGDGVTLAPTNAASGGSNSSGGIVIGPSVSSNNVGGIPLFAVSAAPSFTNIAAPQGRRFRGINIAPKPEHLTNSSGTADQYDWTRYTTNDVTYWTNVSADVSMAATNGFNAIRFMFDSNMVLSNNSTISNLSFRAAYFAKVCETNGVDFYPTLSLADRFSSLPPTGATLTSITNIFAQLAATLGTNTAVKAFDMSQEIVGWESSSTSDITNAAGAYRHAVKSVAPSIPVTLSINMNSVGQWSTSSNLAWQIRNYVDFHDFHWYYDNPQPGDTFQFTNTSKPIIFGEFGMGEGRGESNRVYYARRLQALASHPQVEGTFAWCLVDGSGTNAGPWDFGLFDQQTRVLVTNESARIMARMPALRMTPFRSMMGLPIEEISGYSPNYRINATTTNQPALSFYWFPSEPSKALMTFQIDAETDLGAGNCYTTTSITGAPSWFSDQGEVVFGGVANLRSSLTAVSTITTVLPEPSAVGNQLLFYGANAPRAFTKNTGISVTFERQQP